MAVVALATGCGSDSDGGASADTNTPTSTTTAAPTTSTTLNPNAAVEASYRAAGAAYDEAIRRRDPQWPALLDHVSGEALAETRKYIAGLLRDGLVIRGDSKYLEIVVVSNDGSRAVLKVRGCDAGAQYDERTGEMKDPDPGTEIFKEEATLEMRDGKWKVVRATGELGEKCVV